MQARAQVDCVDGMAGQVEQKEKPVPLDLNLTVAPGGELVGDEAEQSALSVVADDSPTVEGVQDKESAIPGNAKALRTLPASVGQKQAAIFAHV
ncbi:hypothetical protein ES703_113354 [subsurface metagenome]